MIDRVYDEKKPDVVLIGKWTAILTGPDGAVKDMRSGTNKVVDSGTEFLSSFFNSAATAAATFTMRYIALGTDGTAAAASNTALGTEISRHTGVVSNNSTSVFEVRATFAAGSGTGAVVEYGLLSSNTAGTLMARDIEAVINKGASDTLTVTHQLTLAGS